MFLSYRQKTLRTARSAQQAAERAALLTFEQRVDFLIDRLARTLADCFRRGSWGCRVRDQGLGHSVQAHEPVDRDHAVGLDEKRIDFRFGNVRAPDRGKLGERDDCARQSLAIAKG